ncbi:MAG: ABC transporter permease [Treponema sp.]
MIVYKNFLHIIFEKKSSALMYLCIFLILSYTSLQPQQEHRQRFTETPLKICIVDKADSELSRHLIAYLQTIHKITLLSSEHGNDEAILRTLKKDISLAKIHAGIIIDQQLDRLLDEGKKGIISFKDDRREAAFYLDLQIQKFLLFASALKKAEGSINFEKLHQTLAVKTNMILTKNEKNTNALRWVTVFFNFLSWTIFSIILNSIGWVMLELNDSRIRIRNTIAPLSTLRFACETFASQLTVVFMFLFVLIGFAFLLNRGHLNIALIFPHIIHTLIYAAVILSFTFMLNTILKKGSLMAIIGTVLPLSLAFISGIFIAQEYLPSSILTIARFFPTYYFVQANEFAATMSKIDWKNIGLLLLFLFLYFTLGIYFTKMHAAQNAIEYVQK